MIKVSRRDNCDRYYIFKLFGFGLFLHRLHTSEKPDVFHNHPWSGLSLIFGSYNEQKIYGPLIKRRFFNLIKDKVFHRIEVVKPVWTLFFHGPKSNKWRVVDRCGTVLSWEPWTGINNSEITSYS